VDLEPTTCHEQPSIYRQERSGRSEAVTAVSSAWLIVLRRYVFAIVLGNIVWEFAQLPLYTIWKEESVAKIAFAALHCTGGDVLIASSALLTALLVLADGRWPHARYRTVATAAVVGGLGYTIYSEWLNAEIRGSWSYTDLMPQLPVIGIGLSPIAQWLVIPPLAFWWGRRPLLENARPKRRVA
jgi:hypothetical protein